MNIITLISGIKNLIRKQIKLIKKQPCGPSVSFLAFRASTGSIGVIGKVGRNINPSFYECRLRTDIFEGLLL